MKEAYNKPAYNKAYVLNSNSFVTPKVYTQSVPGGMCQTSGECSLG